MRTSNLRKLIGEENWTEYQRLRKNENVYASASMRSRNGEQVVRWRQRTKKRLIEYKGGKCQKCGYDKDCPRAFEFHHRDPKTKTFNISGRGTPRSIEDLKKEVDKCDLLCARCHAEVHDQEDKDNRKEAEADYKKKHEFWRHIKETFLQNVLNEKTKGAIDSKTRKCLFCKTEYANSFFWQKYCSYDCAEKSRRKVERPSKEELAGLIQQKISWRELGRRFTVSDNAVRKWAKAYGLETIRNN